MNNSRREFLQSGFNSFTILVPRLGSTPSSLINGYPSPEFAIGDLVATDWLFDEQDPESGTDFGEVVGMRWVSEDNQYLVTSPLPANSWVYFVCWTHTTSSYSSYYPCYEEDPYPAGQLRRVKRGK